MVKKLIITGGHGVLGTKLIAAALDRYDILSVDVHDKCQNSYLGSFAYQKVDIRDKQQVEKTWQKFGPDLVVHAAAFTDVDAAEEQKELCYQVNVEGTYNVAEMTRLQAAKLTYISTDYVFDGTSGPYSEEDEPHPLGWYGESKYLGEKAAFDESVNLLICRTAGLYGFAPHLTRYNFVGRLIDNLRRGQHVDAFTDQMVNHTIAEDLSEIVLFLASHNAGRIFNVAGADRLSRYDFAVRVAEYFDFDRSLIRGVACAELGLKARRPLQGGLIMDKINKHKVTMNTAQQMEVIQKTYDWERILD